MDLPKKYNIDFQKLLIKNGEAKAYIFKCKLCHVLINIDVNEYTAKGIYEIMLKHKEQCKI